MSSSTTRAVACNSIIDKMVEKGVLQKKDFKCQDCPNNKCYNPATKRQISIHGPKFNQMFRAVALVNSKQPDTAIIKQKISSTTNVFHLPMQLSVIVPSTAEVDGMLSSREIQARVEAVEVWLSNKFGGYTALKADGGYVARENNNPYLVKEPVVKVISNATSKSVYENIDSLIIQLRKWANDWGQEAMGFEFEGDLFYVDRDVANKQ